MNDETKKITVIVPVYKAERYIKRCLDSICNQTYKNLEIILIDDGSPDKSGVICDEYALRDSRIKVIHKKNAGVSSARNDGLDIATGDYITFVDSDDYIDCEMYETLVGMILESEADIAICGFARENEPNGFVSYWKENVRCSLSQQEQLRCLLTNKYYCCSCCEMLFRREMLLDIRFDITKKHNEDFLFIYEAMKKSKLAVYTSEPFYKYCNNQESVTNSAFSDSKMAIIDVNEYIYSDIIESFPELSDIAMREFIRNNITTAMEMARCSYDRKLSITRVRRNIKKCLCRYLFSDASVGYKVCALLISISWRLFCEVIR